jgi:hypothetical protein
MKYWEIIADNLSKAGWSWGCVSAVDSEARTIFVADAHRGDGKRFVVASPPYCRAVLNTRTVSRVIEPRIEARCNQTCRDNSTRTRV